MLYFCWSRPRAHARTRACVRLCVAPHQSESHFCNYVCCRGSWSCFCQCVLRLCRSASLTCHYSLKYRVGKFLKFPPGIWLPHLSGMLKIQLPPEGEFWTNRQFSFIRRARQVRLMVGNCALAPAEITQNSPGWFP